jgi:transcriptional regulator, LysR family
MELQQMRYVIAIADTGSFTRAAERCFVVQSSLSHQIKALERELGVALFARTSRRVELTAAGEAFLPAARASVEAAERAAVDALATSGRIGGTLTVGVIPTVTAVDIPHTLRIFHETHPEVRLHLHSGGSNDFITAIAHGSMDVALLGLHESFEPDHVAWRHLAREKLVAVIPTTHRLAGRRRLRLSDLSDETFVDFPGGSPGRAQSDLAFKAAGVHRNIMFEVMETALVLSLVRHGLAIALLSPAVVPDNDTIRAIPVTDGPVRVEYLAWSEFNPSPAALAFLDVVDRLRCSPAEAERNATARTGAA